MATQFNIFDWYWSVQDSSPSTQVYGTVPGAFVPLADATYVAWLAKDGGNQPTKIDTFASLCGVINSAAIANYVPASKSYTFGAGQLTLTNPPPNLFDFTNNQGIGKTIFMPVSNAPNSIPIGLPITFRNLSVGAGASSVSIYVNGSNPIPGALVSPGAAVTITLKANSTKDGTWDARTSGDAVKSATNVFTSFNYFTGEKFTVGYNTTTQNQIRMEICGTDDGVINYSELGVSRWTADATPPAIYIRKSRSTTPGTYGGLAAGDGIGGISFEASNATGFKGAASISVKNLAAINGGTGSNWPAAQMEFWTNAGGAAVTPSLRMTIGSDGTVTIPGNIVSPAIREKLTAARSYFVNDSTGLDTNTGLAVGTPFKTIQKAVDVVCGLDTNIYNVTINVADGTYAVTGTAVTLKSITGAGAINITGNATTPTNCVIAATSGFCIYAPGVRGVWNINGFHLKALTAGFDNILATQMSLVNLTGLRFEGLNAHIHATFGAVVIVNNGNGMSVAGNFNIHLFCDSHSTIQEIGCTYTAVGTPAIGQAWAWCTQGSLIITNANTYTACVCTGPRYYVTSVSYVNTGTSGNATYFPGSTAGSVGTGGIYD